MNYLLKIPALKHRDGPTKQMTKTVLRLGLKCKLKQQEGEVLVAQARLR